MNPNNQSASSSEHNQIIYDFLKTQTSGVLATVSPKNKPYATVIYFSTSEDFITTFVTKSRTAKTTNLEHNDQVVLVAYDAPSQTMIQIIGAAKPITDNDLAQRAFSNMLKTARDTSETGLSPVSKLEAGGYVAYQITPKLIRMAVYARPDEGKNDVYETIEF